MQKKSNCMNRILLLFILLLSFNVKTQNPISYKSFIETTSVKEKAIIALELSEHYHRFSVDSLNIIGVALKEIYALENDPFVKAVYQSLLGGFDMKKGFVEDGLKMLELSRSFFLNQGDNALISKVFNQTGLCYLLLSDFQKAKDNFNASIKFGDDAQDKTLKFMALINLAQCQYLSGDTISAQLYAKSYLTLALKNEKYESAANANSFLGQIALDQKKNNLAINYFEKQAEFAEKTQSPFTISRAKNNLAISLFFKGEPEHALSLFKEVLEERKEQGVIPYLCDAYLNIGSLYIENKDVEVGNMYLDSSIFLAKNNKLITNHIEALETRMEFDKSQELKTEVRRLKGNQKLILAEQRKLRNIKSSVTVNRGSISTWPWYSYLIFIFIPIVVVLFFKNSLSDKG